VTAGQRLIEEGCQLGLEEGRQLGLEEGRQLGLEEGRQLGLEEGRQFFQRVILEQLRQRFGDQVDSAIERRVTEIPLEYMVAWARGVLSASTLGEFFAIVTAGQSLIEEGRQQGRQLGFQELFLQLLRQRFGDQVGTSIERRVTKASIEQIEVWSRRMPSTSTLGELFDH